MVEGEMAGLLMRSRNFELRLSNPAEAEFEIGKVRTGA